MKQVLLLVFLVGMLILSPILTILSVNVLFGLALPLTFSTWFATFWLQWLFVVPKPNVFKNGK